MSKRSKDDLDKYGKAGQGAADAGAAKTIAGSWKCWKKFLGDTGSLLLQTSSTYWQASKWVQMLPVPPDCQMGLTLVVTIIPTIWKTATDKEWRDSLKAVTRHTVKTVGVYAQKLATKVKEAARVVGKSVKKTIGVVREKTKTAYESAKTAVVNFAQKVESGLKIAGGVAQRAYAGAKSFVARLFRW